MWRKNCLNSPFYKLLVLFKIVESPSMPLTWTKEEQEAAIENERTKHVEENNRLDTLQKTL